MKTIVLICSLSLILSSSCDLINKHDNPAQGINIEKLLEKNALKVTIKTGLSGTLLMKEGNCMPMLGVNPFNNSCKTYPVSRTILIYEYTQQHDVTGYGTSYKSVNSKFICNSDADDEGFFQMTLAPGKYSVFIWGKDKYYANSYDGQSGIYPIVIINDSVSIIMPTIDYAVY